MRPIIRTITPFDATQGTTITFSWTGDQQKSNHLVIRDNSNYKIEYEADYESYKGEHVIPSSSGLLNGNTYTAVVYVTDMSGNISDASSPILFKTFSKPDFKFSNITNDQIATNSNLLVELSYFQSENEPLDSWQVYLYNKNKSELYSTGLKFITKPGDLRTTIAGLQDRTEYYIRAVGTTVNGFLMDTGYLHITVTIEIKKVFTNLELTNRPDLGSVLVKANIISVDARTGNGDPVFIDGDYIDLRNNIIYFDKGFLAEGDFSLFIKLYDLTPNKELFCFKNNTCGIKVTTRAGVYSDTNGVRIMQLELSSIDMLTPYVLYSNYIDYPDRNDILSIKMEKKNNQYNLSIMNLTKEAI